jgi:hypothetical protein
MQLGHLLTARDSFQRLSTLKMPPQTAYRLLKYLRLVEVENAVIEQQRVKLLRAAAGVPEGDVQLTPGSPEHARFIADYADSLETESDLKPCELAFDGLLSALDAEKGNSLSAADLAALEPFFNHS